MRNNLFAKKTGSFIMIICMVFSGMLPLLSMTSIKAGAAGTGGDSSWRDNTQYDIPNHVPQIYSFKWDEFVAESQKLILFKGDTLIYEPEPFDASAWENVTSGHWLEMFKGFTISDGETDRTAEIAHVNEISPFSGDGGTAYTSITITSDKPVKLGGVSGSGAISSEWDDDLWKGKSYRAVYVGIYEIFEPVMTIEYSATAPNSSNEEARIYGGESDPTEYYWTFEEYNLPTLEGKPVSPGVHFDHWTVNGGQAASFFKLVEGTNDTFHVTPPVQWEKMLSGWRGPVQFYASYRSEPDCGTVKLDANGGQIDELNFKIYEVDLSWNGNNATISSYFTLDNKIPTREAKQFTGWYYDAACTQKVNSAADIVYTGNQGNVGDRCKTLYAGWTAVHSISVAGRDGNGTARASASEAGEGTQIDLWADPKPGYRFAFWQVISGGVTINDNSFIMSDSNVVIDAVFEEDAPPIPPSGGTHNINCILGANGSVTSDKQTAKSGETVTLTVTPKDGYKLKELLILDGLGNDCIKEGFLTLENNKFIMPEMNLTIQAIFEKIDADGLTDEIGSMSGTIQFEDEIPDDCILDVRPGTLPNSFTPKDGEKVRLFEISVLRDNNLYPISGNNMIVTIELTDDLLGFDYYRVSYMNNEKQLVETQYATPNGKFIQFKTNHLSDYVVEAGNNPVATPKPGNPTNPPETSNSSPKTGDSSNVLLWSAMLFVSGSILVTLGITERKRRNRSKS